MDFRQSAPAGTRPTATPAPSSAPDSSKRNRFQGPPKWLRLLNVIILFGVAVMVAAIAIAFTRSNGGNEAKYVSSSKYQAVFLNNGQVYFGKINELNNKYVQMTNIYYLTQSSTTNSSGQATASGDYSLVKLGCQQIHDPYDQMLINRDQVTFWENLSDSGKVVTSIKQFQKQNPKGPDCSQVSSQTQATSNGTTQGTNGTNSSTTGTGTTGNTKQ